MLRVFSAFYIIISFGSLSGVSGKSWHAGNTPTPRPSEWSLWPKTLVTKHIRCVPRRPDRSINASLVQDLKEGHRTLAICISWSALFSQEADGHREVLLIFSTGGWSRRHLFLEEERGGGEAQLLHSLAWSRKGRCNPGKGSRSQVPQDRAELWKDFSHRANYLCQHSQGESHSPNVLVGKEPWV